MGGWGECAQRSSGASLLILTAIDQEYDVERRPRGALEACGREEDDEWRASGAKGGAVGLKVAAPRACTLGGTQVYGNINGTDESEITPDVM